MKGISEGINKLDDKMLLDETWRQIKKDFALAGVNGLSEENPLDSEGLISKILVFIADRKNKTTNWDNLNYRIDIPSSIDFGALSDLEYAQIIAYRSLQKVWFRKQFESRSKQDGFKKKPLP